MAQDRVRVLSAHRLVEPLALSADLVSAQMIDGRMGLPSSPTRTTPIICPEKAMPSMAAASLGLIEKLPGGASNRVPPVRRIPRSTTPPWRYVVACDQVRGRG